MARNLNLQIIASGAVDLKSIKERDFSVAIREFAEANNWKCEYRFRSAVKLASGQYRGSGPSGWPDLFMVRDGRAIAAELKSDKVPARASDEQQEWLTGLAKVPGIDTYLWRPRDASEAIEKLR